MKLTEFLLARIAEDEAVARNAEGGVEWWAYHLEPSFDEESKWIVDSNPRLISYEVTTEGSAKHIGAWHPARVLAECEAKRRIVADAVDFAEQYRIERTPAREGMRWASMVAVGQLAVVYADHPDYDEKWRP